MFAYCNNNPVMLEDPSGRMSLTTVGCIINVATSVLCDIACGESVGTIAVNAVVAGISTYSKIFSASMTVVGTIKTIIDVTQGTGDLTFGLFAGGLVIGASLCTGENFGKLPCLENYDEAAALFFDATVGLTANMVTTYGLDEYSEPNSTTPVTSTQAIIAFSSNIVAVERNTNLRTVSLY